MRPALSVTLKRARLIFLTPENNGPEGKVEAVKRYSLNYASDEQAKPRGSGLFVIADLPRVA